MEEEQVSETPVNLHESTRRYIPEEAIFKKQCCHKFVRSSAKYIEISVTTVQVRKEGPPDIYFYKPMKSEGNHNHWHLPV
jgi:hypothetical protein